MWFFKEQKGYNSFKQKSYFFLYINDLADELPSNGG